MFDVKQDMDGWDLYEKNSSTAWFRGRLKKSAGFTQEIVDELLAILNRRTRVL